MPGIVVTDAASGRRVRVSGRGGLMRVSVRAPIPIEATDISDLRALLAADVVSRIQELRGQQVAVTHFSTETDPTRRAERVRLGGLLGIHPPATQVVTGPGSPAPADLEDMSVVGPTDAPRETFGGVCLQVGRASVPEPMPQFTGRAGIDPLALRLALLDRPYRKEVSLSESDCLLAASALENWRQRVAAWAQAPSSPVPDTVRREVDARLDDDLDIPAVLALLPDVQDDRTVPPGAKFETLAFLDRVLGLDLARRVGQD